MISCGSPYDTFGQIGKDHVLSSIIRHDQNGNWNIIHFLSNGTSVHRELQYNILDASDSNSQTYGWLGHLNRNSSMFMTGGAVYINDIWYYYEILYYNDKSIMWSKSSCIADSVYAMNPEFPLLPVPSTAPVAAAIAAQNSQAASISNSNALPSQTAPTIAGIIKSIPKAAFVEASTPFSVPLIPAGEHGGKAVDVTLGANTTLTMIIDTGADIVGVTESIANRLIGNNEATATRNVHTSLADGSIQVERTINIKQLTIGGHILYNIPATVGPDQSTPLLGVDVLNRFGRFSIDTEKSILILG
jgi:clan AA aspartic protease (TIGR02281 family)